MPDRALLRNLPDPDAVYHPSAALVAEIVSPSDETYDKLPFYAAHGVDEVLIVDPAERRVRIMVLAAGRYADAARSAVLNVDLSELEASIRWP